PFGLHQLHAVAGRVAGLVAESVAPQEVSRPVPLRPREVPCGDQRQGVSPADHRTSNPRRGSRSDGWAERATKGAAAGLRWMTAAASRPASIQNSWVTEVK